MDRQTSTQGVSRYFSPWRNRVGDCFCCIQDSLFEVAAESSKANRIAERVSAEFGKPLLGLGCDLREEVVPGNRISNRRLPSLLNPIVGLNKGLREQPSVRVRPHSPAKLRSGNKAPGGSNSFAVADAAVMSTIPRGFRKRASKVSASHLLIRCWERRHLDSNRVDERARVGHQHDETRIPLGRPG